MWFLLVVLSSADHSVDEQQPHRSHRAIARNVSAESLHPRTCSALGPALRWNRLCHFRRFLTCLRSRCHGTLLLLSLLSSSALLLQILSNNRLGQLKDLDVLATLPKLDRLSLLNNPVTKLKHYRLYVCHRLPNITLLDFQKVKPSVSPQSVPARTTARLHAPQRRASRADGQAIL
jgi:hypothetical protein